MDEFFQDFNINASLRNEIFTDSEHVKTCDVNFSNADEISNNVMKDV